MTARQDPKVTENDLLAYVDGELDARRAAIVEAHLAGNETDAARVAEWRRQDEAIGELYGHVAEEEVPARLSVRAVAARQPGPGPLLRYAAAAVLLVAVGAAAGWFGRAMLDGSAGAGQPLVAEAIDAHRLFVSEVVHPVEVKAAEETHLAAWLSKRLDRAIRIPDLREDGFQLVGGRLLPAGSMPAAQFMYEDAGGQRITLYVVPSSDGAETAFRFTTREHLEALYWDDETIRCALVGDLPRDRLQELAVKAYSQLG